MYRTRCALLFHRPSNAHPSKSLVLFLAFATFVVRRVLWPLLFCANMHPEAYAS
ncbi:hypothetical protein PENSPDRAFT_646732 [Peniophora sp. CONT]|nr:hypothetical protein PENSPDRAFT_646732 [Peniophora sp. CONT]